MDTPDIYISSKSGLPAHLSGELLSGNIKLWSHKQESIEDFMLHYTEGQLKLFCPTKYRFKPIELDFNQSRFVKGKDPLLRAIGASKQVVDLTAGWCEDAMHLVRSDITVQAVEQNFMIYLMAKHAQQQLMDTKQKSLLSVFHAEGEQWLSKYTGVIEVIFLDPMYPTKVKQAATKKGMQVLQQLVNQQPDPKRLLELSLKRASKRVIVKRPHYAEPLKPGKVGEITGKLVRFDIYKPCQN